MSAHELPSEHLALWAARHVCAYCQTDGASWSKLAEEWLCRDCKADVEYCARGGYEAPRP